MTELYDQQIAEEADRWATAHSDDATKFDTGHYLNPRLRQLMDAEIIQYLRNALDGANHALEIGCGTGMMAYQLSKELHVKIDACDLSEAVMQAGQEEQDKNKDSAVRYFVADANKTDFGTAKYDVIYSHDSLHHMAMIDDVMLAVKKALKPGGKFVIIENDEDNELNQNVANDILATLDPKYSRSFEDIKPKHLARTSPFEGACQHIKPIIEKYFTIDVYKEFYAFTPWLFRFQYNWITEDDFKLAEWLIKSDKEEIASGKLKGNKKVIIAQ